jgi:hypothetical protein
VRQGISKGSKILANASLHLLTSSFIRDKFNNAATHIPQYTFKPQLTPP